MKVTTVRLDDDALSRVDDLAKAMNRPRNWVFQQAVERYLDYEQWFVEEIQAGRREVEDGKVATDAEVTERFKKWGVDAG